jgi:hypothetical protein
MRHIHSFGSLLFQKVYGNVYFDCCDLARLVSITHELFPSDVYCLNVYIFTNLPFKFLLRQLFGIFLEFHDVEDLFFVRIDTRGLEYVGSLDSGVCGQLFLQIPP